MQRINDQLSENLTMSVLAEAESLASYSRKLLLMSYDSPDVPNKRKSHSPSGVNQSWSHEEAMDHLQAFPTDQKINWTSSASALGIPGKNKGQVLKEYTVSQGVDVLTLEQRSDPSTPHLRRKKKMLPGQEISIPCLPTPKQVKEEKQHLIESVSSQ